MTPGSDGDSAHEGWSTDRSGRKRSGISGDASAVAPASTRIDEAPSGFLGDERAQSVWIGFVLLLTLLLLVLAGYQLYSVPAQNAETEFQHNQDVQADMVDLANALLDVRATRDGTVVSEHRAVDITLGTQYRTRVLTVNPPTAVGALASRDRGQVEIRNASVVGSFQGDPAGTLLDTGHETKVLVYDPGYNEYGAAPTTRLEHSLVYNRFDTADRVVRAQRTVRGGTRRLNVVLYDGNISQSGLRTTLDPETLDGPTTPVPIEPETGDSIELELPTEAPELWASPAVVGDAYDEGEPNARVVATSQTSVTIELRGQWDLQMTRVGFDGGTGEDAFSSIEPARSTGGTATNRTYEVRWDREAISTAAGIEYDAASDTLLVDSAIGSIEGVVEVRERATGTPVENATVDPATSNSAVVAIGNVPEPTASTGTTTADLTVAGHGSARLFAASGDDVDALDVEVGGGDSASAVDFVPGTATTAGQANARIAFDLENTGGSAEIVAVGVPGTSEPNAVSVEGPPDTTNTVAGAGGTLDGTITVGDDPVTLETSAEIAPGATERFEIGQFRRADGNRQNMVGEEIRIVIVFADGSQRTIAITP